MNLQSKEQTKIPNKFLQWSKVKQIWSGAEMINDSKIPTIIILFWAFHQFCRAKRDRCM